MCFFISVNKLMLGSFVHSYAVYKTDFWQYFLHCFLSVFITSYFDTGPSCLLFMFSLPVSWLWNVSYVPLQMWDLYSNLFFFFIKDIYWFTYAINFFFSPQRKTVAFSLFCTMCVRFLSKAAISSRVIFKGLRTSTFQCPNTHLFLPTFYSCITWSH